MKFHFQMLDPRPAVRRVDHGERGRRRRRAVDLEGQQRSQKVQGCQRAEAEEEASQEAQVEARLLRVLGRGGG